MANKNAVVLGGLALGLGLLVWAASSGGESQIVVNPPPGPRPPLPPLPGGTPQDPYAAAAQAVAAAAAAAGGGVGPQTSAPEQFTLLPSPAPLQQGRTYKARLELGALESSLASKAAVKSQFESLGFGNVTVYTTPQEATAASAWPPGALANPSSRSRWVEGIWSKPSDTIEKPSQIQNAWAVG